MSDQRPGYKRGRHLRTRRSTAFADRLARALITVGGIGTIVAVSTVFVFLFWVVKDLFLSAKVGEPTRYEISTGVEVLAVGIDEYQTIAWTLESDGLIRAVGSRDGQNVAEHRVVAVGGSPLTAFGVTPEGRDFALGFADGTVRLASIEFATEYRDADAIEGDLRRLKVGEVGRLGESTVERTVLGQFRVRTLRLELGDPVSILAGTPVTAVHRGERDEDVVVAAAGVDGRCAVLVQTRERDFLSDAVVSVWSEPHPVPVGSGGTAPRHVLVTDRGSNLLLGWVDGKLERWAIRDLAAPQLAETLDVTPEPGIELSALGMLLGGSTVISGRSDGVVSGWFVVPNGSNDVDGFALAEAHRFELPGAPRVVAIASSQRERIFAVGTAAGHVHVAHMTSEKLLADVTVRDREPIRAVAIAPKNDALITVTRRAVAVRPFDPRHASASFGTIFGPNWYERDPGPSYTWQSSSGSDGFEPKLSLIPLIFGTLKATLYSMLLAVPLALLAAIYTSEFVSRRARARIKPLVELMASLPSVVLGFLAAIVIAPAVEGVVPQLLTALVTVPIAVLGFAHLWQIVPTHIALRHAALRLPMTMLALGCGVALAAWIGPVAEQALFGGSMRMWLNGQSAGAKDGSAGWLPVTLPLCAIAVTLLVGSRVTPWVARRTAGMTHARAGGMHLLKFVVAVTVTLGIAWLLAVVLFESPRVLGADRPLDLRAGLPFGPVDLSPIGAFDQRNSLVVGFVMGFAIIPIIYTIAEDALASVPEHLRAASLGAGATTWQTAVRVIVPTAMSGLFSACMVGLGRAVGETMIVLMAAGGTPVMDLNMFGGFRTLSHNIANELPEAVPGSTHFVTLFLAALVLLAITFVINTIAEAVRQRFRRRAYQL